MPQEILPAASLLTSIGVAVTPVGLITTTAILLGSFTGKHNNLSVQLRSLTGELRSDTATDKRRASLKRQVRLFLRRITAIWAAVVCLYLALLSFLSMVLAILAVARLPRLSAFGFFALVSGLVLIGLAVAFELYEIYLGRLTLSDEVGEIGIVDHQTEL